MSLPTDARAPASCAASQADDLAILTDADGQFARNFNRRHFMFSHGLKDHPLFELPNLVELAKRPYHHQSYWSNGNVYVTDPWDINRSRRLTLVDTIANIGDNNSIVILKHVEQDPVYAPVLQEMLSRIVTCSGDEMRKEVVVGEVLILITSPNRVTSYHMDAECNYLIQAVGSNTLSVYDQTDRTLVPHEARELYHRGDYNSIAYDEARQNEATAYELKAGYGVHIPVFAPHWVRNHNNISVALSVNYDLAPMLAEKRIYRANGVLRTLGVTPTPPGISPWRDRLKSVAMNVFYDAYHRLRPKKAYPIWTPQ